MADATLNEVRQRLTRIESRLCRMAEHLNVPTFSPPKDIKVTGRGDDCASLEVPVMDVTLSEIMNFLTKQGITVKIVTVRYKSKIIATLYPLA